MLQAAGLLSLLEAAGWRLARGFAGARVDSDGRLTGVAAVAGRSTRAQESLSELSPICSARAASKGAARRGGRCAGCSRSGAARCRR